jgi:hypothetical protein
VNRRDLIQAAELDRDDVQSRTESLLDGRTVNHRPRRALRMIVSYRDAGIGIVAFEMMMIGIILMIQTAFQYLTRSGTNKKKRKQDGDYFSHELHLRVLLFQRQLENIAFQLLRISSSASS